MQNESNVYSPCVETTLLRGLELKYTCAGLASAFEVLKYKFMEQKD